MAIVVPFKALRPDPKYAAEVAAYPYDVLDRAEARTLAQGNPRSFLHVEKSEIDFPPDVDEHDERVYVRARENLERLIREGIMVRDGRPCFYVYRQRTGGREQYGLVGCVSVAEYESGIIRKHELTRVDKEADRTRHIDVAGAQTGLVFLLYRSREAINAVIRQAASGEPEYDFTSGDGVTHTAWVVRDGPTVARLFEEFGKVDFLYIADGHHRAASAAAVAKLRRQRDGGAGTKDYEYFAATLFPHDQLRILDYNRAVHGLNGLSEAQFIERVREKFALEAGFDRKSPGRPHEFGMYLGGRWYRLETRKELYEKAGVIDRLDVSILQNHLLGPILGIADPRTDERIRFVGGIRGMGELERMVDADGFAVAFSLYPPSIPELIEIADEGQIMPPKSTWFEPKLRSGLFVHMID